MKEHSGGTESSKALWTEEVWGVQRRPGWLMWRKHVGKVV